MGIRSLRTFGHPQDIQQTPHLESILPPKARDEMMMGQLPLLRCDGLILDPDETCHYADRAIYEKKIRQPRGATKRIGFGIFHSRNNHTAKDSVVDIVFEQVEGFFYVTNCRVVFSGSGGEYWDRGLRELLSVKPYLNCVKLQFGKDSYKVFVPDGNLPHLVLSKLRR